jgi:hypothetical protein
MSHAHGLIRFKKDGEIKHYEYDGTADVVLSHHYDTHEEVSDNWRKGEWMYCKCGNKEDVDIYSTYGPGFCLVGKACRTCKSISSNIEQDFLPVQQWVHDYYDNIICKG